MNYLFAHVARVADLLGQHVVLVGVALVVALVIAVPLGVVATRNARAGAVILGITGVIYTIPSLALLALLVTALGLGQLTAIVALIAYAQMILVRGVVAGLRGVPNVGREPIVSDVAGGQHEEMLAHIHLLTGL